MVDERIEKLAKLCVNYSVNIKPKETVAIQGTHFALPLMQAIYKECLLKGAYPEITPSGGVKYAFFENAKEHQLQHVSIFEKFLAENVDVQIGMFCDPAPKELTNVNTEKMRTYAASRRKLRDILMKRETEGKFRWTLLPYPLDAQAQEAQMALPEYENFVYSSCFLDKDNPIAEWKKIRKKQDKLCSFLDKVSKIRVVGEDTDLTLSAKGRKWINCNGQKNMPDGEVFTCPVENSANGTIRFTFPGIYSGREVEDIKLTFKAGKVVKASALKGSSLLKEILKIDGADHIGEFAVGTNYGITRFTKNMLFDEKMGGTMHMALGANPIPETRGLNKSAIHWDILKDMKKGGEIYADNKLFYKNGKFLNVQ